MEEEALATGRSTRATVDLDVGTLLENGHATYELLRNITGRCLESLDTPALLKINSNGQVAVLHLLFSVTSSKYEDGLGNLWDVTGDLLSKGIPTLAKLMPLHFACNADLQGTSQDEFEVHVTAINSSHLCNLNTSAHKVAQEEDEVSRIV